MPRDSNKKSRRHHISASKRKADYHQTRTTTSLVEPASQASTQSPWEQDTKQEFPPFRRDSSSSTCSISSTSAPSSPHSICPDPIPNRSTTSLPPPNNLPRSPSPTHLPTFLAPPFYNRPQTPLPPSPSLTSLLRPSIYSASASPSRPTTPTDSEAEAARPGASTTTLNQPAASASTSVSASALLSATQPPVPRVTPKVPTHEYYGFTLYLTSTLFFLFHILWSFLPAPFLHGLGIYYYPDRWWSLAIPAWIVMAVGFVYVALGLYNAEVLTPEVADLRGIVDRIGVVAVVDEQGRLEERYRRGDGPTQRMQLYPPKQWRWKDVWTEGTDAVLDIPVGGVCEVLYAEDDDGDED